METQGTAQLNGAIETAVANAGGLRADSLQQEMTLQRNDVVIISG